MGSIYEEGKMDGLKGKADLYKYISDLDYKQGYDCGESERIRDKHGLRDLSWYHKMRDGRKAEHELDKDNRRCEEELSRIRIEREKEIRRSFSWWERRRAKKLAKMNYPALKGEVSTK